MNHVFPRPVNGPYYDGWSLEKWMLKVCEETGEAVTACKNFQKSVKDYQDFASEHPAESRTEPENVMLDMLHTNTNNTRQSLVYELTDVITAATSVLEYLGCGFDERQHAQKIINESNAKRDGGRRFKEEEA